MSSMSFIFIDQCRYISYVIGYCDCDFTTGEAHYSVVTVTCLLIHLGFFISGANAFVDTGLHSI